jgi:hypothetical protein
LTFGQNPSQPFFDQDELQNKFLQGSATYLHEESKGFGKEFELSLQKYKIVKVLLFCLP